MPNEPILITSSEEGNSIKMWYFEKGITVPRLLRQRSGHSDAPIKIRFYGRVIYLLQKYILHKQ